jgi:hypothetical protein
VGPEFVEGLTLVATKYPAADASAETLARGKASAGMDAAQRIRQEFSHHHPE